MAVGTLTWRTATTSSGWRPKGWRRQPLPGYCTRTASTARSSNKDRSGPHWLMGPQVWGPFLLGYFHGPPWGRPLNIHQKAVQVLFSGQAQFLAQPITGQFHAPFGNVHHLGD